MCRTLAAFILLTQLYGAIIPSQSAPGRAGKNRGWRAAIYRGLTIGKSTGADMLRVLGKPLSSAPSADQDEPRPIIWHDYGMVKGELPGHLAVEVDSRNNRIVGISISPDSMSGEEAVKYFGGDYQRVGYTFCEGMPGDAEPWPVYEDPNSTDITYIVYRSRGIAIHLDYRGKVNAVYFVSEPMGLASKEDCRGEIERIRRKGKRSRVPSATRSITTAHARRPVTKPLMILGQGRG